MYAATAPELGGRNELFIHDDKPMQASVQARDPVVALRLWRAGERRVGLGEQPGDAGCMLPEPLQ